MQHSRGGDDRSFPMMLCLLLPFSEALKP